MPAAHLSRKAAVVLGCLAALPAAAQQLEPRAYSPAPVGANFLGVIYSNMSGGVVTDASLPLQNVNANVNLVSEFYARTFGLLGRSASFTVVVPYAWGEIEGDVFEEFRRVERSGFGDVGLRLAINLIGGPALTPREFTTRTPAGTLGATLTVLAPTGEYDPSKLINLGANRWAFKPELGLSKPLGKWYLELYGGAWLFTTNDNFFGGQTREQDQLYVVQGHVIHEFHSRLWIAFDATWYGGGATTVDGVANYDRQESTRAGVTLAIPFARRHSLKLAFARGTSVRVGSNFDTLSVGWQILWLDRSATPAKP